jgi:hypothetical protein
MHEMSNTDLLVDGMTWMPLVLSMLLWIDVTAASKQRKKEERRNELREVITRETRNKECNESIKSHHNKAAVIMNEWMNIHQRCPDLLDIPPLAHRHRHRHVGVCKEVPAIFLQHGIEE